MNKINIERCLEAMKHIEVDGNPRGREHLIEEAIGMILKDPKSALAREYIGVKQYAHFGDQRCDTAYGYCPTHGSIVFSIGRVRGNEGALDSDAIYLLECVRDFGAVEVEEQVRDSYRTEKRHRNLCTILRRFTQAKQQFDELAAVINDARVDEQCATQAA